MPDGAEELVEIYRAGSLPEAHAIRILLETEGISVRIENELLQGVVGELPMGWSTAPRLYVSRTKEPEARAIIEAHFQSIAKRSDDAEPALHCLNCGVAMSDSTVCAACGWSYDIEADAKNDMLPAGIQALEGDRRAAESTNESSSHPRLTDRAIRFELTAVLAVGVIPHAMSAIYAISAPPSPAAPYWVDSLQLIVTSLCTIFVTIYLMVRSGESIANFGIRRFNSWDFPLAVLLLVAAEYIWLFLPNILPRSAYVQGNASSFPIPVGASMYVMMVVKYLVAASAEEIVTRAYLITRLKVLFRSTSRAILVSAITFASYHAYQGVAGVVYTLILGVAYGLAFIMIGRIWPLALAHALYDMHVEMIS